MRETFDSIACGLYIPLMLRAGSVAAVCLGLLAGCSALHDPPLTRTEEESRLFGPASMKLDSFSKVKNWTGGPMPDGVEALLEFDDQFGDRTKAAGSVYFELFAYRPDWADPRGARLANPWSASLRSVEEQKAHWESASGAYAFQLAYGGVRLDRSYVLTATYQSGAGKRLFSRIILAAQVPEKGHEPKHKPPPRKP